jgi:hypothetical protein
VVYLLVLLIPNSYKILCWKFCSTIWNIK